MTFWKSTKLIRRDIFHFCKEKDLKKKLRWCDCFFKFVEPFKKDGAMFFAVCRIFNLLPLIFVFISFTLWSFHGGSVLINFSLWSLYNEVVCLYFSICGSFHEEVCLFISVYRIFSMSWCDYFFKLEAYS